MERVLGRVGDGDVSVACWEPGQISAYHCHPNATEIYLCFEGGGTMCTPSESTVVEPGGFVVHPPGELHEFTNGPERTLLFRVRYGGDLASRVADRRGRPGWSPSSEDVEYFRRRGIAVPPPRAAPETLRSHAPDTNNQENA